MCRVSACVVWFTAMSDADVHANVARDVSGEAIMVGEENVSQIDAVEEIL